MKRLITLFVAAALASPVVAQGGNPFSADQVSAETLQLLDRLQSLEDAVYEAERSAREAMDRVDEMEVSGLGSSATSEGEASDHEPGQTDLLPGADSEASVSFVGKVNGRYVYRVTEGEQVVHTHSEIRLH